MTAYDHAEALAGLLGITSPFPDKDVATVAMIHEAKRRGITWAQIAPVLGQPSGKAAKAAAKRLAKAANGKLVAAAADILLRA